MSALTASRARAVCMCKSVRDLLVQLRSMSSAGSKATGGLEDAYHETSDGGAQKVWPDREIPSLNPYDQMRFPLPGNSGSGVFITEQLQAIGAPSQLPEIFSSPSQHQVQADMYNQHITAGSTQVDSSIGASLRDNMDVELRVQDCPTLMKKDFQLLFPSRDIIKDNLTVVSLCHKTTNDMTNWSYGVEQEREALIAQYTETANLLCTLLRNSGYWADFIDPCSGKPQLGPHTTDTMFEVDERYRHFGFEIEDLGCCKVIKHHRWGTKTFVGCVFTTAPSTTPVLLELENFVNSE